MDTPPKTIAATPPTLPPATGSASPPVGTAAHPYKRECADGGCKLCSDRREKKRLENLKHRSKGNPFARPAAESTTVAGPKISVLPSAPGAVGAPIPPKPVVPWTVELVRPLIRQAADLIEKWDGESLVEEARKISDTVAQFVAARVAWNAEAKAMAVDGGADCAVKYLNLSGVSAEYAPELKFGLGVLAIVSARQSLVSELRKMQAAEKASKAKPKEEAKAA